MNKTAQQKISIKYYISSIKKSLTELFPIPYSLVPDNGFTLIEILVAVVILSTLIAGVLFSINPFGQISKAQDAARESDIKQVKVALDLYYHDNNCYPTQSIGIPFGKEWSDTDSRGNKTIYMKQAPQDPKCTDTTGTNCYRYRTDGSSCPQWNVVFSQLSKNSSLTNTCALSSLATSCTPTGYDGGTWACAMSGAVDCEGLLASATLIGGVETTQPTATPTIGPTATPTSVPPPPPNSVTFDNVSNINLNPYIKDVTIMPFKQIIDSLQSINVHVLDSVGNVTSVKVVLYSDGDARTFMLTKTGGTTTDGTWGGQSQPWQVKDTYNSTYGYDIIASDDKGNTQTGSIRANQ